MSRRTLIPSILVAVTLGSVLASSAFAGLCSTRIRTVPSSGGDLATLGCRRNSGTFTIGQLGVIVSNGVKTLSANLQQGTSITIQGMNSAGVALPNCTMSDDVPGTSAATGTCNAAVKWQGTIRFPE